jgi:hypothetical protein
MTDQELKDLVASLAIAQAKTDAQMAKTVAQMAKTDIQMAKTAAQMAKTDMQMAKTDAKLERMGIRLGNMAENHGYTTEDYFFNSLHDTKILGKVKYDDIAKNIHIKSKRLEDEFDIVMYNGNSIALIECKYKAHKRDVENLINKKVNNFRLSHPDFVDYKIYLGIASFAFYDELEQFAKDNGVAILKQKGEVVVIDDNFLKVY